MVSTFELTDFLLTKFYQPDCGDILVKELSENGTVQSGQISFEVAVRTARAGTA